MPAPRCKVKDRKLTETHGENRTQLVSIERAARREYSFLFHYSDDSYIRTAFVRSLMLDTWYSLGDTPVTAATLSWLDFQHYSRSEPAKGPYVLLQYPCSSTSRHSAAVHPATLTGLHDSEYVAKIAQLASLDSLTRRICNHIKLL